MIQGFDQLTLALGIIQQIVLQIRVAFDNPDVTQHFKQHACGAAGAAFRA
jgi:hypothetical protein